MTTRRLLTLLAPVLLLLTACGTASVSSSTTPSPSTGPAVSTPGTYPSTLATPAPTTAATPAPQKAAPSVFVAQTMQLGAVLVNSRGRTLYYFVPERGGRIVCTGPCTGFWPPLLTAANVAPTAGASLRGQLAGIVRSGSEQVTYNHWPLYTFTGDTAGDQTNGQGVVGFGGKWFAARPSLQP